MLLALKTFRYEYKIDKNKNNADTNCQVPAYNSVDNFTLGKSTPTTSINP